MTTTSNTTHIERPPIVAVLGHIDHGKSTLLDYIRKSNVVRDEVGGITQHLSAYEVLHTTATGESKKITFLDTPGHEAFQAQRERGARVADIAILVVSAEDGVKAQTLEALKAIQDTKIPYIVAVNKIDSPKANLEKTLGSLTEHAIYVEGRGGDIPLVLVSAKTGEHIPDLLEMILLVAEVSELRATPDTPATGVVIEAHRDPQKGIAGTLIIRNGTLRKGMYVTAGRSSAPVRIMEDFTGTTVEEATVSAPIRIIGWDSLPHVGTVFNTFEGKREAEKVAQTERTETPSPREATDLETTEHVVTIPLIIKADTAGSIDAIRYELAKLKDERVRLKIIRSDVGSITENDIKAAGGDASTIIIGFHTDVDPGVTEPASRLGITIATFEIIYEVTEWMTKRIEERRPTIVSLKVSGQAKILKTFSRTKKKQIIGGRVEEGVLQKKDAVRLLRREEEIGRGTIVGLQQQRAARDTITAGEEFGGEIELTVDIAPGDIIESFTKVET